MVMAMLEMMVIVVIMTMIRLSVSRMSILIGYFCNCQVLTVEKFSWMVIQHISVEAV